MGLENETQKFDTRLICYDIRMTLPASLTTVTRLSKILAGIMFVGLPFLGVYLGYKYKEATTIIPIGNGQMAINENANKTSQECANYNVLGLGAYPKEGWEQTVRAEGDTVWYIEYNLGLRVTCRYEIFKAPNMVGDAGRFRGLKLTNTLHETKAAWVYMSPGAEAGKLYIADIAKKEPTIIIDLPKAVDYEVAIGAEQLKPQVKTTGTEFAFVGSFVAVEPITFAGGCESEETCIALDKVLKTRWAEDNIEVVVARTDGVVHKFKRNLLPFETKIEGVQSDGKNLVLETDSVLPVRKISFETFN